MLECAAKPQLSPIRMHSKASAAARMYVASVRVAIRVRKVRHQGLHHQGPQRHPRDIVDRSAEAPSILAGIDP
jgi:hypothetical protein